MAKNAKHELVEFLVRRAFDPVMHAKPEGRSDAEKRKLKDVQDATQDEIKRYRDYGSAEEVVVNFKRDLSSEPAKKIHSELRALNLPTIKEVREEFEAKARDLGIKA